MAGIRFRKKRGKYSLNSKSHVGNFLSQQKDRIARRTVVDGYPWTGTFKSREELDAYFEGDKINCLLCGRALGQLTTHINRVHGVQSDTYRERYGIPLRRGLCAKELTDRSREFHSRPEQIAHLARVRVPGMAAAAMKGHKMKLPKWRLDEIAAQSPKASASPLHILYTDDDFDAVITSMRTTDRSLNEVLSDDGRPSRTWFYEQMRDYPAKRAVFDEAHASLSPASQACASHLSAQCVAEIKAAAKTKRPAEIARDMDLKYYTVLRIVRLSDKVIDEEQK